MISLLRQSGVLAIALRCSAAIVIDYSDISCYSQKLYIKKMPGIAGAFLGG